MEQTLKTMLTFGLLVMLLSVLYLFSDWFSKTTGYALGEDEKIKLAQCLATKDVVFYRSSTCPVCDSQIELFGRGASVFLEIAECGSAEECPPGGVPVWKIGSEFHYGLKNFDELAILSGCSI